jgi:hypothetical protein
MKRAAITAALAMMLMTSSCRPAAAPLSNSLHYFPQTGHTLSGEFREAFQAYGGVECLGYPVSQPFALKGTNMQVFQFARMEEHPEKSGKYRVELSLLGDLLQRRQPPLPAVRIPAHGEANRRFYPETGHSISADFLAYFDSCGGIDRFGYPLSEPFFAGDMLVQDFQRGRLRWLEKPEAGGLVIQEQIGLLIAAQEPPPGEALLTVPKPAGASEEPFSPAVSPLGARLSLQVERAASGLVWLKAGLHADSLNLAKTAGHVRLINGGQSFSIPLPPTDQAGETQALFPLPENAVDSGLLLVELGNLRGQVPLSQLNQ